MRSTSSTASKPADRHVLVNADFLTTDPIESRALSRRRRHAEDRDRQDAFPDLSPGLTLPISRTGWRSPPRKQRAPNDRLCGACAVDRPAGAAFDLSGSQSFGMDLLASSVSKRFGGIAALSWRRLPCARRRSARPARRERRGQEHLHPDPGRLSPSRCGDHPPQTTSRCGRTIRAQAHAAGISAVFQELSLIPDLSVAAEYLVPARAAFALLARSRKPTLAEDGRRSSNATACRRRAPTSKSGG